MEIHLTDQFKADITKLKKQNAKLLAKLWELIVEIDNNSENHLAGMGKPERLKGNLKGFYSRRIDQKHRLIYTVREDKLLLISCFGHYGDR